MCLETRAQPAPAPHLRHRQQGAGLPVAIFLITVMALIVTTIVQLQQTTGESEVLDILSTRAFYAAESGAQLAMTQALEGTEAVCVDTTFEFSASGLRGCQAEVQCVASGTPEEPEIRLISTGQCGSGADQAIRQIEVKAQ